MNSYLNEKIDLNSPALVSVYDELPIWSSYFGAVLLNRVPMLKNAKILDIGCGAGFPVIEIAQRSGSSSKVYGIDPWEAGLERARQKIKVMGINNIELVCGIAESLPWENNFFDLVVSNNGINNVRDSNIVMKEILRVLKVNGKLFFTVNLPGTMNEFYSVFREALIHFKLNDRLSLLDNHIFSKRKSLELNIDMIKRSGFHIENLITDEFKIRFADGTAMFNHFFIRLAFLDSWKNLLPENQVVSFFDYLEQQLNLEAGKNKELLLTVPFVCFECNKDSV